MDALQFLWWPFLACVVLTGIHAYLGMHVVSRGVIFVDLSLAQVAALGTAIAFVLGYDLHGQVAYVFSLVCTVAGAAIFAMTRGEKKAAHQEAIIGIVYAVSSALAILVLDRAPEGAEHIKHILVGNLLAVHPEEVMKMAGLYIVIGGLHWWWSRPFLLMSESYERARQEGYRVKWWDFLFYVTFGVVVTSSVAIAGVLLVFAYLVVPSMIALLFASSIRSRLVIGWTSGVVASVLGMFVSFRFDTPTGATVIAAFAVLLIMAALVSRIRLFRT